MSTCTRCGKSYDLRYNIGRWQCQLHPGMVAGGKWTCCQQNIDTPVGVSGGLGCHRADHDVFPNGGVFAYVRDYVGIPPAAEALTGLVIASKSEFARMLVTKHGLKQPQADAVAAQLQREALVSAAYYEREASDEVVLDTVGIIDSENRLLPALPATDPFGVALTGMNRALLLLAGDEVRHYAARLLTSLGASPDANRRATVHTAIVDTQVNFRADLFPVTREVRRIAADVDVGIRLGLPMARFFSYAAIGLRALGHSPCQ